MADEKDENQERKARLKLRHEEIRRYREFQTNGATFSTYGFLFWHPVVGRVSAITVVCVSLGIMIVAAKNATPYVNYSSVVQRATFTTFAIFAIMGVATRPPRAALGFEIGFVFGALVAYVFWIGVNVWMFIETGTLASNHLFAAMVALCAPITMLYGYFCKLFSIEPLIPTSEQWFLFKSRNLTEIDHSESRMERFKRFWPAIVAIACLLLAMLQTVWTVVDLPKIKP